MLVRRLASPLASTLVLAACSACGDDGAGPEDASIVVDIDNGSCGDTIRLTGEYVDWDSDATFCGINAAVLEVEGDGQMDSTAPNGRFDLCTPDQAATRLAITQPSDPSQCAATRGSYTTPTLLVAKKAVIQAGAFYSARSWTDARRTSFFTMIGQSYDATKAQVHVHVDGTQRAVSLAAPHGQAWAVAATAWESGSTGHDVFFPNVDLAGGETMLSVADGAVGTGAIPLVAGTITSVTVKTPAP